MGSNACHCLLNSRSFIDLVVQTWARNFFAPGGIPFAVCAAAMSFRNTSVGGGISLFKQRW